MTKLAKKVYILYQKKLGILILKEALIDPQLTVIKIM